MKRKVFSITMCVALLVLLIPAFAGTVLADEEEQGGTGVVTEVPMVIGLAVSPTQIDFGVVLPAECSGVEEGDRTITLENIGNVDQRITTEIRDEERVVEGENLGHGDGSTTVFGPTDYTPIEADSETVKLDGMPQGGGSGGGIYTMDYDLGTVTFDAPPAGGVLVSINYESQSTFYSGSGDKNGPFGGDPPPDKTYGMTLDDASCPPEVLAKDYERVLVDDNNCDAVAQIYVEPDYPVGIEPGQIVFWAEGVLGNAPPVVEITVPTEGQDIDIGEVITVTAHITDDWGVLGAAYMIDNPMGTPTLMALVSGNACDGIYEAAWDTTGQTGGAHTVYVGCQDTNMEPGLDAVGVNLHVVIPAPVVTSITTDPVSPVDNLVRITATATADPLSGGLVGGAYSIDDPFFGSPVVMTPDVPLPALAVTFEADWDCTAVENGPHTIYVGVTDALGQPGVNLLAIEVDNPPPLPALGAEWVYEVTYGPPTNEVTTWTYTYDFDETVGAVDCYHTVVAYSSPPARVTGGTAVTIYGAEQWNSKETMDQLKAVASIDLFGMILTTYLDRTYTGDPHGWKYGVGKAWGYSEFMTLVPPMSPDQTKVYEVEVVAQETVLGYDCYKIEYILVEVDGAPVTPVLEITEWWSEDVSGMVKKINHTGFDEPETSLLTSYTPGP